MRDQLAVRADNNVAADNTVGTDRRALADHSAIFNPRGGIDRAHRGSLIACRSGGHLFDFAVVSAGWRGCPVTSGYVLYRRRRLKAKRRQGPMPIAWVWSCSNFEK